MKQDLKTLTKLLDNLEWPAGLETGKSYVRLHDDHDGTFLGTLRVGFSPDGDAWVETHNPETFEMLRFRGGFGGGRSVRTRNALVLLALAMMLDEKERTDYISPQLKLPFN